MNSFEQLAHLDLENKPTVLTVTDGSDAIICF